MQLLNTCLGQGLSGVHSPPGISAETPDQDGFQPQRGSPLSGSCLEVTLLHLATSIHRLGFRFLLAIQLLSFSQPNLAG